MNPKFAFFGTSRLSVFVLEQLKQDGLLPELIVTQPDKPVGRKQLLTPSPVKKWALENKVPFIQPENIKNGVPELKKGSWDVFILASYGKIIPTNILEIPKRGILNVHPSLLPKYRGATPIQNAILNGDSQSGVTIMLLDEEMDHGPILKKEVADIKELDYLRAEEELAKLGGKMLADLIPEWLAGNIDAKEQNHSDATYVRKFESKDGFIDSKIITEGTSLEKTIMGYRKILALNPEPGTYTILNTKKGEVRLKIITAKIINGKLLPQKVVPAGKKEMPWSDFLKGNEIIN